MIEKLKKGAYWRMRFVPHPVSDKMFTLKECRELVKGCRVRLRERPFPYFRPEKIVNEEGAIQCVHDGKTHKEWWRMRQSGQFEHHSSLREEDPLLREEYAEFLDILLDESSERGWDDYSGPIGISCLLHTITEYFTFLAGCVQKFPSGNTEFNIEIGLHGVRNRVLVETDVEKKWDVIFKTGLEEIQTPERVFTHGELIAHADDLAVDTAIYFYKNFGWRDPDRKQLEKEQQKFFREP